MDRDTVQGLKDNRLHYINGKGKLVSMGLDRFPQLKADYFGSYKRLVYLVRKPEPALMEQAKAAATYLGLPLEIRATGYNFLEARLLELLQQT